MSPGKGKLGCAVVITVKDDAVALQKTLRLLAQQSRIPYEVVLTVADSSDSTLEVAKSWAQKFKQAKVIRIGAATRSEGRNRGVEETQQEIIVFTDAGCYPERDWLEQLLLPFKQPATSLVSGYTRVAHQTAFAEAQGVFVLVPLEKIDQHPLPATRNMALRRSVFEEVGGFQKELNFSEDFELARRLHKHGYKSFFAPLAIMEWQARSSILEFFQMIARLTRGDVVAGTWRLGHLSMWLRYTFFVLFFLAAFRLLGSGSAALPLTGMLYAAYLGLKVFRFRFTRRASYFWAILLQMATDFAVLYGTFTGLLTHTRKKYDGR